MLMIYNNRGYYQIVSSYEFLEDLRKLILFGFANLVDPFWKFQDMWLRICLRKLLKVL